MNTNGPNLRLTTVSKSDHRRLLLDMFRAAIDAAAPALCLPPHLPAPPKGRTIVVGAGKAAAAMAAAVEAQWQGPLEGLVVTRYGHSVPCSRIEVIEASHPVPDEKGSWAAQRILDLVSDLSPDDLVIALLSGGGSALLTTPPQGVSLADLQELNKQLLLSPATIRDINCVRRHVGGLGGGRIAAACHPAKVVGLVISDVPGDDLTNIASGPTVGDPTTCADAIAILKRLQIAVPDPVLHVLRSETCESIKPNDPRLAAVDNHLVAAPMMSLDAAAGVARQAGLTPYILGDCIEGEARHVGTVLAGIARHVADHNQPFAPPCVILSGGETTVAVRGNGQGGRNREFLLGLGIALDDHPRILAIAGDTDGVDGTDEVAGAIWMPDSRFRAAEIGLKPTDALDANDTKSFFDKLGDQLITGPTLTNVNDFRAMVILDRPYSSGDNPVA